MLLLSTMSTEATRIFLESYDLEFNTIDGTICKFHWPANGKLSVSLWVACQHPVVEHLASSFLPHMDACVCLYHDRDCLSCVRVDNAIKLLQQNHSNVWMMATTVPPVVNQHSSRVRHYYNENGFEIDRLIGSLGDNLDKILRVHLSIQKNLF